MENAASQSSGLTVAADDALAVSVICTARNAASTIEATIRSIIAQDGDDWELVIIDDGSTDDTAGIVRRWAARDPRIRLVATEGIGRGRALNLALAETRAELVANLDADDEAHPRRLRCQRAAMEEHPEFAILCTREVRVENLAPPPWPTIEPGAPLEVTDVTRALALSNPVCHSSAMMRKAAITAIGGYDEARRVVFDYDLWVRAAAAGLRLGRLELSLTAKRLHPGQAYLHSARLRYIAASLQVQARAMRALGVRTWYLLPALVLRFLWLILPLSVRHGVNKLGAAAQMRDGR